MDVKRAPQKKTKRNVLIAGGVVGLIAITVALSQLEARPPTVQRGEIIIDSVRRGELVREVRAPGTLVSENMRFVAAVTAGRVEAKPIRPGSPVTASTIILVLSNPDEQLQALDALRQVTAAEQDLVTLRTNLETSRLNQEGLIAQLVTQHANAVRQVETFDALDKRGLAGANELKQWRDNVSELATRLEIERRKLELQKGASTEQLQKAEANLERLRAISRFRQQRLASLNVPAGLDGVLTVLNLELGQWVNPGQELARVAQPGRFKAVLRVPDTQAKDVVQGQKVAVDTRPAIINGRVMRVDPISTAGTVTVEVALEGNMPPGARGELSVDGTIELERIRNAMFVGRPAYGQPESTVGIFKLDPDGKTATRVNVKLGRHSVNHIEVTAGLQPGDKIIISDMTAHDNVSKVRIN